MGSEKWKAEKGTEVCIFTNAIQHRREETARRRRGAGGLTGAAEFRILPAWDEFRVWTVPVLDLTNTRSRI